MATGTCVPARMVQLVVGVGHESPVDHLVTIIFQFYPVSSIRGDASGSPTDCLFQESDSTFISFITS